MYRFKGYRRTVSSEDRELITGDRTAVAPCDPATGIAYNLRGVGSGDHRAGDHLIPLVVGVDVALSNVSEF